jgi:hypothetical protein
MLPIICSNDAKAVLESLKAYLLTNKKMQDIVIVEANDNQIVFLVDDKPIMEGAAQIWWSGYSAALNSLS